MSLNIRIFLGYAINAEIKNLLFTSQEWKQHQALHRRALEIINLDKKEFIGSFIPSTQPNFKEILEQNLKINLYLEECCPELRVDKLKAILIPQFFLG